MDTATSTEHGVGFTAHFTRSLAAPRELVFRLWTDAEHLAKWWGPAGFTNPVCEFDPRPGGPNAMAPGRRVRAAGGRDLRR